MAEPMFKIVSEPATEDWCGDCDEDSDRNSDMTIIVSINQVQQWLY